MVSVCLPSDALHNTYRLTWVSLTLVMGYLFTAALAKHSLCSLPWMRGISSLPPLLTLNVEYLISALLRPRSCRSLDLGLLLWAAAPDLGRGVAPLGHASAWSVACKMCVCVYIYTYIYVYKIYS